MLIFLSIIIEKFNFLNFLQHLLFTTSFYFINLLRKKKYECQFYSSYIKRIWNKQKKSYRYIILLLLKKKKKNDLWNKNLYFNILRLFRDIIGEESLCRRLEDTKKQSMLFVLAWPLIKIRRLYAMSWPRYRLSFFQYDEICSIFMFVFNFSKNFNFF